jgi:hypothetical protein
MLMQDILGRCRLQEDTVRIIKTLKMPQQERTEEPACS